MQRFELERRVSHADVDMLGEMKVSALLGCLEQAAVEASAAIGFDPEWYAREGRVWIIRRTRLRRLAPVGGRDLLSISTQIADYRRARSLRRYEVRRIEPPGAVGAASGERPLTARATTDWVYCEIARGRPTVVPDAMRAAFSGEHADVALERARPLPDAGPGEPIETPLAVRPSHLDHVVHVNNAAYADFLEDAAFALFAARGQPLERMLAAGGALRPEALDVEYLDDARAGDALAVRSWLVEHEGLAADDPRPRRAEVLQTISRGGARPLLRAASTWVWRRKPPVLGAVPLADEA